MKHAVRTFRGHTMREALERVKRELGDGAVILGTRSIEPGGIGHLLGRRTFEITAAPPETITPAPRVAAAGWPANRMAALPSAGPPSAVPGVPPRADATPAPVPAVLAEHYRRLVEGEVAASLAARLVEAAAARAGSPQQLTPAALREELRSYIARTAPAPGPIDLPTGGRRRVALIGPPGAGKTTTLAKLAAHFTLRAGRKVVLLSLDLQRLAAHEQLRRYAEIIGIPLFLAQGVEQVRAAVRDAGQYDLMLIDTPGVGLRERGRFARLAMLLRAARPDEQHLVVPVSLAPAVQARVAAAFSPLRFDRAILTRMDDAVGFGVVLGAIERLGVGLSYLCNGQNVPADLEEACLDRLVELV